MSRTTAAGLALLSVFSLNAFADPAMGNWEGKADDSLGNVALRAEVVGMSETAYRVDMHVLTNEQAPVDAQCSGLKDGSAAVVLGTIDLGPEAGGAYRMLGTATDGTMSGTLSPLDPDKVKTATFTMERVYRKSPTLGLAPPGGAVVLLDGADLDEWTLSPGNLVDGTIRIGASSFVSRREFGSHKVHVEFCTPYMPECQGQDRGNSGVYLQGRYEVQVLDSFGDPPASDRCGGIYKIAVPAADADLPPGEWQTYDIEFTAPVFDGSGQKVSDAKLTVMHNGVLIHDNQAVPHPTAGCLSRTEAPTGPLMLQNHHNPVQYRNIWVLPAD